MVLKKLAEILKERSMSIESVAILGKGDFSSMTVRRASKGKGIDLLKAKAIAKALHLKMEELA